MGSIGRLKPLMSYDYRTTKKKKIRLWNWLGTDADYMPGLFHLLISLANLTLPRHLIRLGLGRAVRSYIILSQGPSYSSQMWDYNKAGFGGCDCTTHSLMPVHPNREKTELLNVKKTPNLNP